MVSRNERVGLEITRSGKKEEERMQKDDGKESGKSDSLDNGGGNTHAVMDTR